MPQKQVHIIGAGLAGLAAAVALAEAGYAPQIWEAGPQAGGRCRSYFDKELGVRLDNGNHLLLSGNAHAMRYLDTIGARQTMVGPAKPIFPFIDLAGGQRWTLRPNLGKVPWWLFAPDRRVPDTTAIDYLEPLKLAFAGATATVAETLSPSPLFRRLWEPLAVSALNTRTSEGSSRLFWPVIKETLGAGGCACIPLVPKEGLSESFIDPAIAFIAAKGGSVTLHRRLARLQFEDDRVAGLDFAEEIVPVASNTPVILAVTAPVAAALLPSLAAPTSHRSILNLHYRIDTPRQEPGFIGVVGGTAEWVFQKNGILSVTVSAADHLIDQPAESLAEIVWRDLVRIYPVPDVMPPWRVVKEKRATFAATPSEAKRRPNQGTDWRNLFLAGDWTATGLPGTIEGSIRSGNAAAALIVKNT